MADTEKDDIFKAVLDKFQTERNRLVEESFARAFSENDDVRLFFINADKAYTDGRNIVVDPAFCDIYKDEDCIKSTEMELGWPGLVSATPWNALKMVCRGLTLHECLHLLYSNFPGNQFKDPDFFNRKNELKTVSNISNIIEDAYIEAVGSSVYDNVEIYLMFNRVAPVFAKKNVESTASEKFKLVRPDEIKDFSPPEEKTEEGLTLEAKRLLEEYLRFLDIQKKTQTLIEVPENPEEKAALEAKSYDELKAILIEEKEKLHNTTEFGDKDRIIKAILINRFSKTSKYAELKRKMQESRPKIEPLVICTTLDRKLVRARIAARLRARMDGGLIEEIDGLHKAGWSFERLESLGLEYRFVSLYLQGVYGEVGSDGAKEMLFELLNRAIGQFAKRQETWFRGMEKKGVKIHWLPEEMDVEKRFEAARNLLLDRR